MGVYARILTKDKERELRRRITQKEIAAAIGVMEQVIARWMKNEVNQFDGRVIARLCAYFNCTIADLLYLEAVETEAGK
ncbi:MAG: helix-turn-helix transcriptional regulator [Anaerolineae bacterium]|nr:helix-turn-helix transcriptional regulator [Anaerolineae bacterium]